jgi:hypothetical protein
MRVPVQQRQQPLAAEAQPRRAEPGPAPAGPRHPRDVLALQRTAGNHAVGRMLAKPRLMRLPPTPEQL